MFFITRFEVNLWILCIQCQQNVLCVSIPNNSPMTIYFFFLKTNRHWLKLNKKFTNEKLFKACDLNKFDVHYRCNRKLDMAENILIDDDELVISENRTFKFYSVRFLSLWYTVYTRITFYSSIVSERTWRISFGYIIHFVGGCKSFSPPFFFSCVVFRVSSLLNFDWHV